MENANPLVSVIIPLYNAADCIEESIESVLNQSFQDFEIIVCDDCSCDNSREIVLKLAEKDSRIHLICNVENSGAACSRNNAIAKASGRFIAFLDSDDKWLPQKLEKQLAFMNSGSYALSCTAYEQIDEDGRPFSAVVRTCAKAGYWKILFYGNPLGNSTVMFDSQQTGKVYAPDIRKRNDFALWLKISKKGFFAYGLDEVLAQYRLRDNSLSSDKTKLAKYQWDLYRNIEGHSVPICLFAMITWAGVKTLSMVKRRLS